MATFFGQVAARVRRGVHRNDAYLTLLDWLATREGYRTTPVAESSRGGTELHRAIADLDVARAAELLVRGADVSAADEAGHTALDRAFSRPELVHAIRQRYQLMPRPGWGASSPAPSEMRELSARGIVKLPAFVAPDTLEQLRSGFAAFVGLLDRRIERGEGFFRQYHEEDHFWPKDGAYITNNAFKYSDQLVVCACHESVLALTRHYFGKPVHIQRAVGMGYLPGGRTGHDMFAWHHDLEGRRLKLMILLTEISKQDHTMSYVVGSHRIEHPWHRFQQNRLSLGYCSRRLDRLEIVETTGVPGDAYVFDSNGAHMGNRRSTARRRDVFMVEYNSDPSNIYGGDVHASALTRVGEEEQAALML
ncbi:MAG TPA: phytanoyl-CoA dioxygenase family protein, partial [Candidatus Binatia bacterium]|nr:phytanoyl-CoA dioxygenase family protein [Candidatus Binatia bacterium]